MLEKILFVRSFLPHLQRLHQALFPLWNAAHRARSYVKLEQEVLLLPLLVVPGSTAIDVGAHSGSYAWYLRKLKADVQAFEPNPTLAAGLRVVFSDTINIHCLALSDRSGYGMLEIPFDAHRRDLRSGDARVVQHLDNSEGSSNAEYVEIETSRLDAFDFRNVSFIKIDVEGHELSVLRGGSKTLREQKPNLLIEAEERHSKSAVRSLVSYLAEFDYAGFYLFGGKIYKIEEFKDSMQDLSNLDTFCLGSKRKYINNFIFVHRSNSWDFLEKARKRLG